MDLDEFLLGFIGFQLFPRLPPQNGNISFMVSLKKILKLNVFKGGAIYASFKQLKKLKFKKVIL